MYEYSWYQWLTFFFIYCFFGWIFESTYVSLKKRQFVNRGFLRLPLLPLYGTGAVMMLWVSLPVKDNLFLVYVSGVVAATVLEYVTGWGMERLFKMKYWDYSNQRFNVKGYICLSSSIAWGFLTILLTEVIHRPIERYVLGLPLMVDLVCVIVVSLLFAADTAESVKAALDLAKVLDAMTNMRAELDDIQVQMALLKAETVQRMEEAREEASQKLGQVRSEAASRTSALKEGAAERLNVIVENTVERMGDLMEDTAERVGVLVEGTADKVARTAERLAELTEDAAARVSATLGQKDMSGLDEAGKEGGLREEAGTDGGCRDRKAGTDGCGWDEESARHAFAAERRERIAALSRRLSAITEKRHSLSSRMGYYRRSLLKGNPTASSSRFAEALKELREIANRKK
ncbi:MAG: putative ABC transporter permease [Enterocloster aldenensis]